MRSWHGRPIVESSDSPLTVDAALHESVGYWNEHMPDHLAFAWQKKAADAWGALQDGFSIISNEMHNPDGDALLYIAPDELELALVAHGCELIDQKAPNADSETVAIDGLLKQIDHIRQAA